MSDKITSWSAHIEPVARLLEEVAKDTPEICYVFSRSGQSVMAATQPNLPPNTATGKDDTPVVVVTVLMTLIATIFIGLRLYGCVLILRRRLYLEEWLCVINQVRWGKTRSDLANHPLAHSANLTRSLIASSSDRSLVDGSIGHQPVHKNGGWTTLGNAF